MLARLANRIYASRYAQSVPGVTQFVALVSDGGGDGKGVGLVSVGQGSSLRMTLRSLCIHLFRVDDPDR